MEGLFGGSAFNSNSRAPIRRPQQNRNREDYRLKLLHRGPPEDFLRKPNWWACVHDLTEYLLPHIADRDADSVADSAAEAANCDGGDVP
jgi:hypothetical protein